MSMTTSTLPTTSITGATVLVVSTISKSYHSQPVLNDLSLTLVEGSRVGLVGANGVGKSTLLKIIVGQVEADSGGVQLYAGRRMGYLAQTIQAAEGRTLQDLLDEAQSHLRNLETRLRDLEFAMASAEDDALDAILTEYGEVTDAFERAGGYTQEARLEVTLAGLRVDHLARDREFSSFSGGEKARVGLALLLLEAPDVLLLDEPTNHLDWATLDWLEKTLSSYRGALLIVSHDRTFLNHTVNAIVEIDEHTRTAKRYSGNYDSYLTEKTRQRAQWQTDYEAQQEEIRRLRLEIKEVARRNNNYRPHTDKDKFVRNAKIANHDETVSARVQRAETRLRWIHEDPVPEPPEPLQFHAEFDPTALRGRYPLTVERLSKCFGDRTIFDDVSFTLGAQDRIALVGENGAGKSTLLHLITGALDPDHGLIEWSPTAWLGVLDQEQRSLDPTAEVMEAFIEGLEGNNASSVQQHTAMLLRTGLFRLDDLQKRVGELSVGQQRKLQVAKLMRGGANVLLLDEPTNHISFDVLEALESALPEFPGAIIAATHDRRFLEHFDGAVWEVRDGRITSYESYARYLEAKSDF
jgi:macrolide transport system ATP-binding/permease protein